MIVETIPVSSIREASYNPRADLQPQDPEYQRLAKVVDAYGLVLPLIWNRRTGNLVGGHQRLKILRERQVQEVEVSVVDLDERQERILNLTLNKQSGVWEYQNLSRLLKELDGVRDLDLTGFAEHERLPLLRADLDRETDPSEQRGKPVHLTEAEWRVVMPAIEKMWREHGEMTEGRALELLCAEFLS